MRRIIMKKKPTIVPGEKFGRLTVRNKRGSDKHGNVRWTCECECGGVTITTTNCLTRGNTKSCGCLVNELRPHIYEEDYDKKFMDKIKSEININNSCWEMSVSINEKGYPYRCYRGKQFLLHRWMYEKYKGQIPEGLCVLHQCDNPLCINPDHLRVGTQKENMGDMHDRKRDRWSRERD